MEVYETRAGYAFQTDRNTWNAEACETEWTSYVTLPPGYFPEQAPEQAPELAETVPMDELARYVRRAGELIRHAKTMSDPGYRNNDLNGALEFIRLASAQLDPHTTGVEA